MTTVLVLFLVGFFIGIPILIYDKTVEISSKYTFTRFLIAWPLRLSSSLLAYGIMIVLSFLPITIVVAVIGVVLSELFNFSYKYAEYIVYGVLILNAIWLAKEIVLTTVKEFINDFTGKAEEKTKYNRK